MKTKIVLAQNNSTEYDVYHMDRKDLFNTLSNLEYEQGKIMFLGDSLIDKCEWQELLNNSNIINRGINADTTKGVLDRIGSIINLKPKKIFIMIGTNDIGQGESKDVVIKNYNEILESLKSNLPNTEVYVQSLLPVNEVPESKRKNEDIISINSEISLLSDKYNYTYIDLFSDFLVNGELNKEFTLDGLHINGQGYSLWANKVKGYSD